MKIILLLIFANILISAQNKIGRPDFPRDTSYTFYSAAVKMHKLFPDAKLVLPSLPANVSEEKNIVYAKIGERELHLDIFYPSESITTKFPGVVLVHGGGWSTGDRAMVIPIAERLASEGFVTTAVEYRLSPEALYPAAVFDLKAAIRWMRANAEKYKIDIDKIVIYGCSAGGHLAALIGTTNGEINFEGTEGNINFPGDVQAVIDVDGVVDFFGKGTEELYKKSGKPSAAHLWFGASPKEKPELWKEASPINHVGRKTPPMLFINSGVPRFHAGRDEMIEKLNSYKIYSEVHTLKGTIHTFWLFDPWFGETLNYTLEFLNKVLKSQK